MLENDDIALQKYKQFAMAVIKDYCPQFEGLNEIFENKLNNLGQLKQEYFDKAISAKNTSDLLDKNKNQIANSVKSINEKNVHIYKFIVFMPQLLLIRIK